MQIYKFGGSSLSNAERIQSVKNIIRDDALKIVVLSANGKTTNLFTQMAAMINNRNFGKAVELKSELIVYYLNLVDDLFGENDYKIIAREIVHTVFQQIQLRFEVPLTQFDMDWLVSRGEILSTALFSAYLSEHKVPNRFMWAEDIIYKDQEGQADKKRIKQNLDEFFATEQFLPITITQGFICRNYQGLPDTFGRGGSDFTASLLGELTNASVIQIWSDVDGFLNNDPDFVRGSLPLKNLSFDEAAELAYFGARILHPQTMIPAKNSGIPVLLKNTLNPNARGTVISEKVQAGGIKAIAAKNNITSITIHSGRMLMAYGFLNKIFEIFEKQKTAVDMVTTSEVSVSVTIDSAKNLNEILAELEKIGQVNFQHNLSIICIVGDQLTENQGNVAKIFTAIENIPVRMISYGAAKNSISLLVNTEFRTQTLESLNRLFELQKEKVSVYV